MCHQTRNQLELTIIKVMSVCLVISNITQKSGYALQNKLILRSNCVCPGYTLTLAECTVVGKPVGTTVWKGTVFDQCATDELNLLHLRFDSEVQAKCNNGSIIGRGLRVEEGCYTSELTINVSSSMIGKTVQCIYYDTNREISVSTLTITGPGRFLPPKQISLRHADLPSKQLTFTWNPPYIDCPAIHYNMLASNCGSCPTTTNYTNVTCTNVPTDGGTCTFAIQTVVCTDMIGNQSSLITIELLTLGNPKETLPILIIGILLLIIVTPLGTLQLIIYIYKKRLGGSKLCSMTQTRGTKQVDVISIESGDEGPVKEFDNQNMGMYGIEDYSHCVRKETISDIMDKPPNLNTLVRILKGQITSKWYQFGVALGIPQTTLEQLTNYNEEDSLIELLDYWLKHHPNQPTWQEINNAQEKMYTDN